MRVRLQFFPEQHRDNYVYRYNEKKEQRNDAAFINGNGYRYKRADDRRNEHVVQRRNKPRYASYVVQELGLYFPRFHFFMIRNRKPLQFSHNRAFYVRFGVAEHL